MLYRAVQRIPARSSKLLGTGHIIQELKFKVWGSMLKMQIGFMGNVDIPFEYPSSHEGPHFGGKRFGLRWGGGSEALTRRGGSEALTRRVLGFRGVVLLNLTLFNPGRYPMSPVPLIKRLSLTYAEIAYILCREEFDCWISEMGTSTP